jgi:hypothetical protein
VLALEELRRDARREQALFDKVVTDWERIRLFERG